MTVGLDINAIIELMKRVGELRWGTIGKQTMILNNINSVCY